MQEVNTIWLLSLIWACVAGIVFLTALTWFVYASIIQHKATLKFAVQFGLRRIPVALVIAILWPLFGVFWVASLIQEWANGNSMCV